jgi:tetratricopeptide (TPR) repeat protein
MKQIQFMLTALMVTAVLTACGSSAARYNNRGNSEYTAENYDDAMENYASAQQEDPDLAAPYYNAGNARYRQNNQEQALAQLEQSLRTADNELAPRAYHNLGNTYFQMEDWTSAIDAYRQALLLDPDDLETKLNLELALKKQQEQEQQQQQQNNQQNDQDQQDQQDDQENEDQQQGGGQGQQNDEENEDEQQGGGQPDQEEDEENESGGQQPDQDQSGGGSQSQGQSSGGSGGLSRAEAEQLLDALGQDGQTLQERLQQRFGPPSTRPDKDW